MILSSWILLTDMKFLLLFLFYFIQLYSGGSFVVNCSFLTSLCGLVNLSHWSLTLFFCVLVLVFFLIFASFLFVAVVLKIHLFIVYVCVCTWVYICTLSACSTFEGQKRVSDPLDLELQLFERSLLWVPGTECRSFELAECSQSLSHLSSLEC